MSPIVYWKSVVGALEIRDYIEEWFPVLAVNNLHN